jgi:ERO1-like protein alpha
MWLPVTEIENKEGTYVNLQENPHTYTGYQGQHIWTAIFKENCFSDELDKICSEEKVFYKLISGIISNVNVHISVNYVDMERNLTYLNVPSFMSRFAKHLDRVDNLFFLYSLLVKAFDKAEDKIKNYKIETGNLTEDASAKKLLKEIYESDGLKEISHECNQNTDTIRKFLNFKNVDLLVVRFRNISSIINCVSCQKCKLYGKLQIYGLATMLKMLFDKNNAENYTRNEIISFVNFLAGVSSSISNMKKINDDIRFNHFTHKLKYVLTFIIFVLVFSFLNFVLFKNRNTPPPATEDKKQN